MIARFWSKLLMWSVSADALNEASVGAAESNRSDDQGVQRAAQYAGHSYSHSCLSYWMIGQQKEGSDVDLYGYLLDAHAVPFEGVYRQWGSVVVVSECGGVDATVSEGPFSLGSSRIDRLILIRENVVLQWTTVQEQYKVDENVCCIKLSSSFCSESAQLGCGMASGSEVANSSLEVEHMIQRSFLSADFNTRILQHVPMNLMNGSSALAFIGSGSAVSLNACMGLGEMDAVASSSPLISAAALTARNSSKTLKCPKCNWHYKYHETLEIHMKEKHADNEVKCVYCLQGRAHPRLARGESYSCGYKPYRCELCKYSTTTKGNLSIHMQSDKHLHAMQEMPSILSGVLSFVIACKRMRRLWQCTKPVCRPNVHEDLMSVQQQRKFLITSNSGTPCTELDSESTLQCLVCSNYSSDSIHDMLEHIEKDRSRPVIGDMSILHGVYQCNLCPYSTNLKANFQLHTRTDKHLQRVQMVSVSKRDSEFGACII
ncbi:unnamed protein product [Toxocara canis]|uniref:C2H2-type domain-containing protein n=1 Tax=Toxocara canis TaxID=6265 RepID=A0A183TVK1_TOXCA|nr:unnamed protein product [Toxocara canis]